MDIFNLQTLYIDPSVMTYTIQIIVGAVVTVGAVLGIVWRKLKKNVKNKLNIDDDKNKEIEDDIEFVDTSASNKENNK